MRVCFVINIHNIDSMLNLIMNGRYRSPSRHTTQSVSVFEAEIQKVQSLMHSINQSRKSVRITNNTEHLVDSPVSSEDSHTQTEILKAKIASLFNLRVPNAAHELATVFRAHRLGSEARVSDWARMLDEVLRARARIANQIADHVRTGSKNKLNARAHAIGMQAVEAGLQALVAAALGITHGLDPVYMSSFQYQLQQLKNHHLETHHTLRLDERVFQQMQAEVSRVYNDWWDYIPWKDMEDQKIHDDLQFRLDDSEKVYLFLHGQRNNLHTSEAISDNIEANEDQIKRLEIIYKQADPLDSKNSDLWERSFRELSRTIGALIQKFHILLEETREKQSSHAGHSPPCSPSSKSGHTHVAPSTPASKPGDSVDDDDDASNWEMILSIKAMIPSLRGRIDALMTKPDPNNEDEYEKIRIEIDQYFLMLQHVKDEKKHIEIINSLREELEALWIRASSTECTDCGHVTMTGNFSSLWKSWVDAIKVHVFAASLCRDTGSAAAFGSCLRVHTGRAKKYLTSRDV